MSMPVKNMEVRNLTMLVNAIQRGDIKYWARGSLRNRVSFYGPNGEYLGGWKRLGPRDTDSKEVKKLKKELKVVFDENLKKKRFFIQDVGMREDRIETFRSTPTNENGGNFSKTLEQNLLKFERVARTPQRVEEKEKVVEVNTPPNERSFVGTPFPSTIESEERKFSTVEKVSNRFPNGVNTSQLIISDSVGSMERDTAPPPPVQFAGISEYRGDFNDVVRLEWTGDDVIVTTREGEIYLMNPNQEDVQIRRGIFVRNGEVFTPTTTDYEGVFKRDIGYGEMKLEFNSQRQWGRENLIIVKDGLAYTIREDGIVSKVEDTHLKNGAYNMRGENVDVVKSLNGRPQLMTEAMREALAEGRPIVTTADRMDRVEGRGTFNAYNTVSDPEQGSGEILFSEDTPINELNRRYGSHESSGGLPANEPYIILSDEESSRSISIEESSRSIPTEEARTPPITRRIRYAAGHRLGGERSIAQFTRGVRNTARNIARRVGRNLFQRRVLQPAANLNAEARAEAAADLNAEGRAQALNLNRDLTGMGTFVGGMGGVMVGTLTGSSLVNALTIPAVVESELKKMEQEKLARGEVLDTREGTVWHGPK